MPALHHSVDHIFNCLSVFNQAIYLDPYIYISKSFLSCKQLVLLHILLVWGTLI